MSRDDEIRQISERLKAEIIALEGDPRSAEEKAVGVVAKLVGISDFEVRQAVAEQRESGADFAVRVGLQRRHFEDICRSIVSGELNFGPGPNGTAFKP